jgi:hypothetical protein
MAATYLSAGLREQLVQAQAELNRHLATGLDGRCLVCGGMEPCQARQAAEQMLARYGVLPVRRPGLASQGMTEDGRGFGWFEGQALRSGAPGGWAV